MAWKKRMRWCDFIHWDTVSWWKCHFEENAWNSPSRSWDFMISSGWPLSTIRPLLRTTNLSKWRRRSASGWRITTSSNWRMSGGLHHKSIMKHLCRQTTYLKKIKTSILFYVLSCLIDNSKFIMLNLLSSCSNYPVPCAKCSHDARVLPLTRGPRSSRSNKAIAVGASTAPKGSSKSISSAPKW